MVTKRPSRAPVQRSDGTTTRHELVIRMLVNSHPAMQRNGFSRSVKDLLISLGADADYRDDFPPCRFVPDAYRIDHEAQDILIYEVEDTNPISPRKLEELAEYWFWWESEGQHDWMPRLFVVDRYGASRLEIDLQQVWYACLDNHRSDVRVAGATA